MPARTERTITDVDALLEELERVREQGYAVDDGEQELGVRCVAVAVPGGSTSAVSVSGPAARVTRGRSRGWCRCCARRAKASWAGPSATDTGSASRNSAAILRLTPG